IEVEFDCVRLVLVIVDEVDTVKSPEEFGLPAELHLDLGGAGLAGLMLPLDECAEAIDIAVADLFNERIDIGHIGSPPASIGINRPAAIWSRRAPASDRYAFSR